MSVALPAWLVIGLLWAVPAVAQELGVVPDGTEAATGPLPIGSAGATVSGQGSFPLAYTLTPNGPRFALVPIAESLGVELRVGPKGDSHTLIFGDRNVIVGPEQALMVVVPAEGEEEVLTLRGLPIRDAQGLKVPLDFLERTFGEQLNYRFLWDPVTRQLEISRQELRELDAAVNLVHQHGIGTVEVRFSERPRYRVEHLPGALEIQLIGDRLQVPVNQTWSPGPLVSGIVVRPDGLRIELRDNATAAEPRLLSSPIPSLIVEIFQQTESRTGEVNVLRAPSRGGVRTIVLDPGHGGEETGAVGPSGIEEAQLTLMVGRALKRQLERRLPVRVVLTRNEDVAVPHDSRTAIANQNKADLFISLHFNSSYGPYAHGAETYFLSREASDQLAAEAAAAENRSGAGAADPELGLQLILWDLAQTHHLAESQRFAKLLQEELNLTLGLRDRGVKQAPFRVLMGATMPAVLVELGFISNPEEEAKVQDPAYIAELVDSLVRAVVRFKAQLETREAAPATNGQGTP